VASGGVSPLLLHVINNRGVSPLLLYVINFLADQQGAYAPRSPLNSEIRAQKSVVRPGVPRLCFLYENLAEPERNDAGLPAQRSVL